MKKLLEHIQNSPSDVKGRYAFFIALGITLVIGLIWASTIPSRFATIGTNNDNEDAPSPLNELMVETRENLGTVIESMEKEEEVFSGNMDALSQPREEAVKATTTISDFFIKDENTATTSIVAPRTGPRTILIGTTTRE